MNVLRRDAQRESAVRMPGADAQRVYKAEVPMSAKKPLILLVEDNAGDAQLVTEALHEIGADIQMNVADDGEKGLQRLLAMETSGNLPDLIIMDFNLPRMSGSQLLARMRTHAVLAGIPTIMLTSTARECDRAACAGAQEYLIKGATWVDVLGIARRIVELLDDFTTVRERVVQMAPPTAGPHGPRARAQRKAKRAPPAPKPRKPSRRSV